MLSSTSGGTRANAMRTAFLLGAFPFVLPTVLFACVFVAAALYGRPDAFSLSLRTFFIALGVMIAFSLVWFPIGYLSSQWIIDRATGARLVDRSELPRVWAMLDRLCERGGMRVPALRVVESSALNAYASGLAEGNYSVTLTRGLIQTLSDDELAAVIGHELTHILNHDVRLLVIGTVLVGAVPMLHDVVMSAFWAIVMFFLNLYRAIFTALPIPFAKLMAEIGYVVMFWTGKVVAYVVSIISTISSLIINAAISREREFMADAGAVALTGNPGAMIGALRKISGNSTLESTINGIRAMCIENAEIGWSGLFATHPPIADRIAAVERLRDDPSSWRDADTEAVVDTLPEEPAAISAHSSRSSDPAVEPLSSLYVPPDPDPSLVTRYARLLRQLPLVTLRPEEREHLYARVRQAIERGQDALTNMSPAEITLAKISLEEAIYQIELELRSRL